LKFTQRVAKAAESCARHPWRILSLALALSILAGWATIHLPVHTSRQALMPNDTDVAQRLNAFLEKFGAASDLIVVLEGAPRDEMEVFASELATRLRGEPEIGQATERLDIQFLQEHAYLLIPPERLDQFNAALDRLHGKTSADQSFGLDDLLRKGMGWLQHPPPLTDVNIETVQQGLDTLTLLLDEWRRWLSATHAPTELDWNPLLARFGAEGMAKGYFASRDGRMVFLFVQARHASQDFQVLGPFVDKVKAVVAASAAQAKAAGRTPPIVGLTGLPAIEYEEYTNIRRDITLVICTAAVLIALLILAVVRSLRWALVIFIPMGLGVLWSLGLALVTVGHLTIITSSFIAILFGLGADYGIFTSSRIAEERRAGKPLLEAIGTGIGSSFIAVLTAGGASILIFGALATVDFPGFAELGVVATKGVLLILISTWMIQPALYALFPPRLKSESLAGTLPPVDSDAACSAVVRGRMVFPWPAAATLVVAAVGCAGIGVTRGFAIPFDYDVLALLPEDSQAAYYQRRMVAESDYQAEVVILTANNLQEARRITEEASRLKTIAKVHSLTHLFPTDGEARVQKARTIGKSVSQAGYAGEVVELERTGLPEKAFDRLRAVVDKSAGLIDEAQEQAFSAGHVSLVKSLEGLRKQIKAIRVAMDQDVERGRARSEMFLRSLLGAIQNGLQVIDTWQYAKPLTPEQLPPTLRNRFFAEDGTIAVYAFPAHSVYDPVSLDALMQDVYGVTPEATGFPTTHQAFSKAVVQSFTHGTLLALVVGLLWISLVLRNWRAFVLATLPLLIGGGWMLGLMSLSGIRYNYANIVALPLVIALAVDYGVWFSYRWRELKNHTPLEVSVISGSVIALAAGTELAGLGAITLADYRGVSSLGVSITIGLLSCLIATLFVAPAIGQFIDPRRRS
jgi:predicted RND superfamily exporter protein